MDRREFLSAMAAAAVPAPEKEGKSPVYLLIYDHGGLVLWGIEHFAQQLRDAMVWLERYPGFKIGLDNEGYTYDYLAGRDPALLAEVRRDLERFPGRFGIGTCTYGQSINCE
jgi:alpha-mannosidase